MLRPLHISRVACALLLPVALGGGMTFSRAAWADSSSSRGRSPQLQARALFKESQDLRQAGDLRGALAKLQEAYDVLPTPTLLWPIAELRLQLKQPQQGLEAIAKYRQEMAPSDMEPGQQLSDADKLEEKLRAQLGYLRPTAAAGATISIDGKDIGKAPLSEKVMVNPGSHQLTATIEGRSQPFETSIEVQAGQEIEVALTDSPKSTVGGYFPHPLTWAAIGVTTASLFASTVLGGITISETRSLDASCDGRLCLGGTNQDVLQLNSQVNTQRTHAIAAGTLIGFTTLFVVGTTVLILVDYSRQKSGRTLLAPRPKTAHLDLFSPVVNAQVGGASFGLGGRF
jgi:hypothetical protein